MTENVGIIFLDQEEALFTVYGLDESFKVTLTYAIKKPLPFVSSGKKLDSRGAAEIVADFVFKGMGLRVTRFGVVARDLPRELTQTITKASGLQLEELTKNRERELLMKGVLLEMT